MISLHNNKRRIAVVTAWPPSPDNLDWPTALPYHLLQYAPAEVELHLFYFKGLEKHRAVWEAGFAGLPLASKTELQPYMGRRERWMYQLKNVLRPKLLAQVDWFPVRKRDVRAIQAVKPDGLWLYPHWLTPWVKPLGVANTVVTGPDSALLYHERWETELLRRRALASVGQEQEILDKELAECQRAMVENGTLERMLLATGARIHVVGQADADRFTLLGGQNGQAVYTAHPHYHYLAKAKELANSTGKIRVFVNGHAGGAYVGDHAARMTASLVQHAVVLQSKIVLDLVGQGWETFASSLVQAGYEVVHQKWVADYDQALAGADVALGLYAVGVGTKGKILQAMATGLLVVGSDLAFENINAVAERDFVQYTQPEEVGPLLIKIAADRRGYAMIAAQGAQAVRSKHSPEVTAQAFWKLFEATEGKAPVTSW